jgi:hypothetical protein
MISIGLSSGTIGRRGMIALALAAAFVGSTAQAQQAQPTRVRGVIEKVSADAIVVKQRDGSLQTVQLAPNLNVSALVKAKLSDIKQGVFVGTTALPDKDGNLRAVEVHIFPESMRGVGEGHYPWDVKPTSSMTNASVTEIVTEVKGSTLTLKYKGGENKVTVPRTASIVSVTPGSRDDLKKGAKVFAIAAPQPDGTVKTGFLLVGRGVSPPM